MDVRNSARVLSDTLAFNDDVLSVLLTDMTDELARRRLRDEAVSDLCIQISDARFRR